MAFLVFQNGDSIEQNAWRGYAGNGWRLSPSFLLERAMIPWVIVLHVTGVVLWVCGLLGATVALVQHTQETSVDARASLAQLERRFLRGVADPGAALAILTGITLLTLNPYYLRAQWLQWKLSFVVLLIVLHGLIRVRAKQFGVGQIVLTRRQALLLAAAVVGVVLLILTATLPGSVYLT